MRMCLEIEFSEIGKSAAISVTRASVSESRARMARRVGSHSALNTPSSWCEIYSPIWVNIGGWQVRCQAPRGEAGLQIERDAHRAMIRTHDIGMDLCGFDVLLEFGRHQHVVDSPSHVACAGIGEV